mmetsp:Transcript_53914/g.161329  ORF Transcript_53914/g.161329 Transcript_53914/m.161329 type:complete len:315 (-) Transcript_53914:1982-2926(-)
MDGQIALPVGCASGGLVPLQQYPQYVRRRTVLGGEMEWIPSRPVLHTEGELSVDGGGGLGRLGLGPFPLLPFPLAGTGEGRLAMGRGKGYDRLDDGEWIEEGSQSLGRVEAGGVRAREGEVEGCPAESAEGLPRGRLGGGDAGLGRGGRSRGADAAGVGVGGAVLLPVLLVGVPGLLLGAVGRVKETGGVTPDHGPQDLGGDDGHHGVVKGEQPPPILGVGGQGGGIVLGGFEGLRAAPGRRRYARRRHGRGRLEDLVVELVTVGVGIRVVVRLVPAVKVVHVEVVVPAPVLRGTSVPSAAPRPRAALLFLLRR